MLYFLLIGRGQWHGPRPSHLVVTMKHPSNRWFQKPTEDAAIRNIEREARQLRVKGWKHAKPTIEALCARGMLGVDDRAVL